MATDLTDLRGKLEVSLEITAKKAIDLGIPEAALKIAKALALTFGTDANQANQIWWDRRTLAADAIDAIDLAGTLTNPLGGTAEFANVKALVIFNRSDESLDAHTATDARLTMGQNGEANTWPGPMKTVADGIRIVAGGVLVCTNPRTDGWSVTDGAADMLEITNDDGSDEALYDIVVVGEAA